MPKELQKVRQRQKIERERGRKKGSRIHHHVCVNTQMIIIIKSDATVDFVGKMGHINQDATEALMQ